AVSPDGTRGLTGSGDNTARLWDLQSGQAIGLPMQHGGEVLSVTFSNDGAFALTGAGNGEVRLWDATTAHPIGPPARHDGGVTRVRSASDDGSFLTLCPDGAARRWPVSRPVAGDPSLVKSWVQTITGEEQDAGKAVSVLGAPAWRERRAAVIDSSLAENLEPGGGAAFDWHDAMAGGVEISRKPQAALWDVDGMLAR